MNSVSRNMIEQKRDDMASKLSRIREHRQAISDQKVKLDAEDYQLSIDADRLTFGVATLDGLLKSQSTSPASAIDKTSQAKADCRASKNATNKTKTQTLLETVPVDRMYAKSTTDIWQIVAANDHSRSLNSVYALLKKLYDKGRVSREKRGKQFYWFHEDQKVVRLETT